MSIMEGLDTSKLDELKYKVKDKLDETQLLFDSLMQEYFG